jgi:hypothetical protein
MTQRSAAATEAARRLWARDAVDVRTPEEVTATVQRVCAQLRAGLARWIGSEGYRALVRRALEQERVAHPVLSNLSCDGGDAHEIAAAVRAHGAAEVTAGIVVLTATLIDLLGRIVGEEMALQLVEQTGTLSLRGASVTETEGGRDG